MPLGILFILFIFVPILEIYILVRLGGLIGASNIVLLTILTAFWGVCLIKNQGGGPLGAVKSSLEKGVSPARSLLDGLCVLIAGVLLFTPGVLSDCLGFLLLIPWTRTIFIYYLLSRLKKKQQQGSFKFTSSFSTDQKSSLEEEKIIDVESERVD